MLRITNTLTRSKENFIPLEKGKVRFYHCGPTVYWTQHIGNMRAMVMADIIRRSLLYLGYDVTFVRNYTDVGHLDGDNMGDADQGKDRMETAVEREGGSTKTIADKYIKGFEEHTKALNVLEPDHKPRATKYVEKVIDMVESLINKGFAYTTDKAVYFDVSKAKNYFVLSRQDPEQLREGAGAGDVKDTDKRNPRDFALWFFKTGTHANALQTWPSSFQSPSVQNGEGFPGWHIECSAMSKDLLGDTIDIHMGGIEHIPIHHTNEIAQSEGANGTKFVNYWLHNEHLTVDGGKMAKSEGTGYSLDEVIERGFDPLALRYFFLSAHYRSQQNFTWEALDGAKIGLQKLKNRVLSLGEGSGEVNPEYVHKFKEFVSDDFDIPRTLALAWDLLKDHSLDNASKRATLLNFDKVLGLGLSKLKPIEIPQEIEDLLTEREKARKHENWEMADELRTEIESHGYIIDDTDDGPIVTK